MEDQKHKNNREAKRFSFSMPGCSLQNDLPARAIFSKTAKKRYIKRVIAEKYLQKQVEGLNQEFRQMVNLPNT